MAPILVKIPTEPYNAVVPSRKYGTSAALRPLILTGFWVTDFDDRSETTALLFDSGGYQISCYQPSVRLEPAYGAIWLCRGLA